MSSQEYMDELVRKLDDYDYTQRKVLDMAYRKGRKDKYQEITSEYMLLTEKQVADIRVDVIEEFAKWLSRKYGMFSPIGLIDGVTTYEELNVNEVVEEFVEQLKEQKE